MDRLFGTRLAGCGACAHGVSGIQDRGGRGPHNPHRCTRLPSKAAGEGLGAGECISFTLLWVGYVLTFRGVNLYLELGLHGKVVFGIQFAWLALIILVATLANGILEGGLAYASVNLVESYGPLPAGVALAVGGSVFALFARATTERIGKRELSP